MQNDFHPGATAADGLPCDRISTLVAPLPIVDGDLSTIPAILELAERRQWVVWRGEDRDGNATKVPYDPGSGWHASVTDPTTWSEYDSATAACRDGDFSGIGFVLTTSDPYVALDLDHCRNPQSGTVETWAQDIVDLMDSYTEVSPSGAGLRIFVRGVIPGPRRRSGQIEMYADARYVTVTGQRLAGTALTIEDRQPQVDKLYSQLFTGEPVTRVANKVAPRTQPKPLAPRMGRLMEKAAAIRALPRPDDEILRVARQAASGPKFTRLFDEGRWQSHYPSQSEADMALCGMLAYWTDREAAQMDRLFRKSALFRPKWDERRGSSTYGQRTIETVLANAGGAYGRP
ncbi:MAG: hypothetical protein ABI759_09235 [Candidatus Solibacter sp.]